MAMLKKIRVYQERLVGLGKRLFLVDGVGALLSATILGGVLARFPVEVGMSRNVLLLLAGLALVFAFYSFSCYLFTGKRWRSFLRAIAVVNALYCLLTFGLMYADYGTLRWLGAVYFMAEIAVILFLVNIELKASEIIK